MKIDLILLIIEINTLKTMKKTMHPKNHENFKFEILSLKIYNIQSLFHTEIHSQYSQHWDFSDFQV